MTKIPLTVHSVGTPNGRRITVLLKHLGIPFEYNRIDITKGEQFSEEFKTLNPYSRIPVIEDADPDTGEKVVLFESGAILLFLVQKYDIEKRIHLEKDDGALYWDQMKWLFFASASISPTQCSLSFYRKFAAIRDEFAIRKSLDETERICNALNLRLEENNGWLVGDRLNIADVATYTFVKRSGFVELDVRSQWPAVWNYLQKLDAIEGFEKGYSYDALG